MTEQTYKWTDNPTESGVAICDTDVLNDCLMHLKYDKKSGDGFSLFDTKVSDHVLQGDEVIGWALQGSCVTMTYPQAVGKIVKEYGNGADVTVRGVVCKKASNGHIIADISQKPAIDELYTKSGIADFYILDSVNQQFYLPKSKWFNQFTVDTSFVNHFNEAGLPNIEGESGWVTSQSIKGTGAFSVNGLNRSLLNNQGNATTEANKFDASNSNPVYGNSDTVQPPSSNKLLYYKVGNMVINESLIDVGEVLSELNLLDNQKLNIDHSNDTKPYVKEISVNGLSGYIEFSTGLLVQWGKTPQGAVKTELVREYKENNYIVLTTWEGTITQSWSAISIQNRLPSSFESYSVAPRYWLTIGK